MSPKRIKGFITQYLQVFFWSVLLLTAGVFSNTQRRLLSRVHKLLWSYHFPPTQTKLPVRTLSDICGNEQVVKVTQPMYAQGNTTSFEQLTLNNLAKYFEPKKVFEIGTFDGRTTLNLAINCPDDAEIYTIDLAKDDTSNALLVVSPGDQKLIETNVTGSRFLTETAKTILGNRKIYQLLGDSATFDFSPYHNSFDFIFVDAAHTYEYVKNDSQIAIKLLRGGKGVILWHDYDYKHSGSVRAIEEIHAQHPEWKMFHIKDTNIALLIKD